MSAASNNHMAPQNMATRIHRLIANLDLAVESRDLSRIACAEHALRKEVIALVEATDLMHGDATERMTALNDALVAVRRSIDILMDQSAQQTVQKNAKLVYLHTERVGKRGR